MKLFAVIVHKSIIIIIYTTLIYPFHIGIFLGIREFVNFLKFHEEFSIEMIHLFNCS